MLLDTSGLVPYYNVSEPHHADAARFFRMKGKKLTHSYVLSELVTLTYARGLARPPLLVFVTTLLEHREVEVVWVDEDLHRAAMALLQARPDKDYSLCDAVSFVLMRRRNILEALTTDKHFVQEGFVRLLAND